MALSLSRRGSRGHVGLDVDGRYLAAVQVDGRRVTRAASAELDPDVVRDGEIRDPAKLGEALKRFFAANDLPKNVSLGVSNQQIVLRQIDLPRIEDAEQRDAAVRFQAAEAIAMPLDEAVLDWQPAGEFTAPEGTTRMRFVVVAARRSMVDTLVQAATEAGLKPSGIDLDAFALLRAVANDGDEQTARVYCHLGGVTNLVVAVGSTCRFTRALSIDAQGGRLDPQTLLDEIRLSIDSYTGQPDALPVEEVVLSGPGLAQPGLVDELSELMHVPVRVAQPLGSLDTSAMPSDEDPHRHTVAAGLAMGVGS